jgi:hypothetical protein
MGPYNTRPITLDPGLTALALRGLRDAEARFPFLGRLPSWRRRREAPPAPAAVIVASRSLRTPYFIIVRRGQTELFRTLQQDFKEAPHLVRVIWDRRSHERRRGTGRTTGSNRRQADRRARPPAAWEVFGFILAPLRGSASSP